MSVLNKQCVFTPASKNTLAMNTLDPEYSNKSKSNVFSYYFIYLR